MLKSNREAKAEQLMPYQPFQRKEIELQNS